MKLFRLIIPCVAGLLLAVGTLAAFAGGPRNPATAPLHAVETDLFAQGGADDIHADATGKLWITEIQSNSVRELDPATGAYTIYTGIVEPFDAQIGPDGHLWWLEGEPQAIGRMDLSTRSVTTYPVDTIFAVALTFDEQGRAWFVDNLASGVYRFTLAGTQYCDITLPGGNGGPFIAARNGALWLGEAVSSTLGRITPTTNAYTYWPLAFGGGTPLVFGLTFAPNGDVYWADGGLHKIGRLEPASNRLTLYGLDGMVDPQRVAYQDGRVWFTDPFTNALGYVDPATAIGVGAHVATPTVTTLTPDCHGVTPHAPYTAGLTTGTASFSPVVLTTTASAAGTEYQVPGDGWPWGLVFDDFNLWVTDVHRDKLMHIDTAAAHLFLPLVRH